MFKLFGKNKEAENKGLGLLAVCDGEVIELSAVEDPVFAEKMMGDGFAMIPSTGEIVSPFDGQIELLIDTKHAVTIKSNDGLEVLVHVGLDTVNLGGTHFEALVNTGDTVKKGDTLLKFDIQGILNAGYKITTPVIVVNTEEYSDMTITKKGSVKALESVLSINK